MAYQPNPAKYYEIFIIHLDAHIKLVVAYKISETTIKLLIT